MVPPELPVPLAPMEVLPPVLGLAAVEPLLVLGGLAAVEPLLVLGGLAAVEPLLELVSAPVLGVGADVLGEPVAAPVAVPPPPPGVPLVWATDSPPNTRAAAAARLVRVFLVVIIATPLMELPKGIS
jgi:hypothetical protein